MLLVDPQIFRDPLGEHIRKASSQVQRSCRSLPLTNKTSPTPSFELTRSTSPARKTESGRSTTGPEDRGPRSLGFKSILEPPNVFVTTIRTAVKGDKLLLITQSRTLPFS